MPIQDCNKKKVRSASLFLLCCSASLFAFFANLGMQSARVDTFWNGNNLVVEDSDSSVVLTHLAYRSDGGETIAALPLLRLTHGVLRQVYNRDDLRSLKWIDHRGHVLPPPRSGEAVHVLYYAGNVTGSALKEGN